MGKSAKAWVGGAAAGIVGAIVALLSNAFGIEINTGIVSVITMALTAMMVWFVPNAKA